VTQPPRAFTAHEAGRIRALEGGFGFLQYFIHPNRRTVHDRIAETIVVTVRQSGKKK